MEALSSRTFSSIEFDVCDCARKTFAGRPGPTFASNRCALFLYHTAGRVRDLLRGTSAIANRIGSCSLAPAHLSVSGLRGPDTRYSEIVADG